MELSQRVAYLKGLMDGMKIDDSTDQGKLLKLMADMLEDMALCIEDVADEVDEVVEIIDEIDGSSRYDTLSANDLKVLEFLLEE